MEFPSGFSMNLTMRPSLASSATPYRLGFFTACSAIVAVQRLDLWIFSSSV